MAASSTFSTTPRSTTILRQPTRPSSQICSRVFRPSKPRCFPRIVERMTEHRAAQPSTSGRASSVHSLAATRTDAAPIFRRHTGTGRHWGVHLASLEHDTSASVCVTVCYTASGSLSLPLAFNWCPEYHHASERDALTNLKFKLPHRASAVVEPKSSESSLPQAASSKFFRVESESLPVAGCRT